jgi:adenylate cyclase class 2
LLEALEFRPVAEVRKERRHVEVDWQGMQITASLDQVNQVGSFAELEMVVEPQQIDAAKKCLASLAEHLQLADSQRRSYLELLLDEIRNPKHETRNKS